MANPKDIIRAVGAREAAKRLGVSPGTIRVALSRGKLPSQWFDVLETMCADAGQECPRAAFTFRQEQSQ